MKKYLSMLIVVCVLLCVFAAIASADAAFYTVTYHNNHGNYESTSVQTKEPGKSVTIERCDWGYSGNIFAGWATSPDATEAELKPGDVYKTDANLDLYAVWNDAYELGEIKVDSTYQIPAFPVTDTTVYMEFSVAETGYYRMQTTGGSLKNAEWSSSPYIEWYDSKDGWWDDIARGETISTNKYYHYDVTVTAKLEAGERYRLYFSCGPDPIKLAVDGGFSNITYHNNYGSYESTKVQTKEPGKSVTTERCDWGYSGSIFAGWATSTDATEAEYKPGDVYKADVNLDLYAVWNDAYQLGEVRVGSTYQIPAFPVADTIVYMEFSVTETGYYRLQTTGGSLKNAEWSSSPYIEWYDSKDGWWDDIARGETISTNKYYHYDVTVTAKLEAGERYRLYFSCGPDPIKLAVDNNFSCITYYNNYGNYESTKVQTKEKGKSVIIEQCDWGYGGSIFAGWATSPDATAAEYKPGDVYKTDANLDLYAIWNDPYQIGAITGPVTCAIPAFPVTDTTVYMEFVVTETGYYRLQTTGGSLKNAEWSSSPYIEWYDSKDGWWDDIARGETISTNKYYHYDITVTAKLEAGEKYRLYFICGPDPITLECQPQYEIKPYSAAITLPADLRVVQSMTFTDGSFESVYIPANVEKVEENAFYNCPNITKVVIASMDAEIDENAFGDNDNILIVAPLESAGQAFAEAKGFEFRRLVEE